MRVQDKKLKSSRLVYVLWCFTSVLDPHAISIFLKVHKPAESCIEQVNFRLYFIP